MTLVFSMQYKQFFVFLLVFSFFFTMATGDGNLQWQLQKNENGIKVYTRLLKGYGYKEVKVVNTVRSTLSGIVALLLDTKNYTNWVSGCESTSTLKTISAQEFYNYQVTALPWPLSNRDVVSRFKVTQDAVTRVVTFSKTGEAGFIPEKDGLVRVQNFLSVVTLTPLTKDSVQVVLQMHLDPGGNIPDWIYNDFTVSAPFNSTAAMVKQLPKYQWGSFSFIKEK